MKSMAELAGGELCLPQQPHNQEGAARRRRRRGHVDRLGKYTTGRVVQLDAVRIGVLYSRICTTGLAVPLDNIMLYEWPLLY